MWFIDRNLLITIKTCLLETLFINVSRETFIKKPSIFNVLNEVPAKITWHL